ncbi:hypothetical protein STEG23_026511, partial [Scotinomys teguina]
ERVKDVKARCLLAFAYMGVPKELKTGTDPVLVWARGAVCVFLQDGEIPVWVPEHCVCTVDAPPTGPDRDMLGPRGESPVADARKDQ